MSNADYDSPEYKAFRTGYTYREVSEMVWSYSDDYKDWPKSKATKRRHLVLGKWRELKKELWNRYQASLQEEEIEEIPW